jgi:hypothetical protein
MNEETERLFADLEAIAASIQDSAKRQASLSHFLQHPFCVWFSWRERIDLNHSILLATDLDSG